MSSLSLEAATAGAGGDSHSIKSLPVLQSLEGYEHEFDPPVDSRFECPICLLVLREPSQTKCGHRFCRDCILRTLKNSSSRCPIDNEPLTETDIYPDNYAKREILNCTIKCPNKEGGCEKVFPLCELKSHLQDCQFTLIPCPNKCGSILPQKDIANHVEKACGLRIVMCTCCGANIHAQLTHDHVIVCPKVPVKCENCHTEMTRDLLKHHLQTACENMIVRCPFYPLGCGSSLKRRCENKHLMEEGATHLRQLCGAVTHILAQMNVQRQHLQQIAQTPDFSHGSLPGKMEDSGTWLTHTSSSGFNQASTDSDNKERSLHQNHSARWAQNPSSNAGPSLADCTPGSGGVPQPTVTSVSSHQRAPKASSGHPNSLPTYTVHNKDVQKAEASSMPFMGLLVNQSNTEAVKSSIAQKPSQGSDEDPNTYPTATVIKDLATTVASLNLHHPPSVHCRDSLQGETEPKNVLPTASESAQGLPPEARSTIPMVFTNMEQVTAMLDHKLEGRNKEIAELKSTVTSLKKRNAELSQAVVELQENILSKTCHGRFYWKIQGFTRHKQRALRGEQVVFHSQPFYTSPWGYKVCLRASITAPKRSGDESALQQHLSLFIHVMQGDNDPILPWPFNGKILLALLDQNKNEAYRKPIQETIEAKPSLAAFQRPVQPRNQKGFGFTEFVPVDRIEGGSYLANDCLLVHAHVFTHAG